MLFELRKKWQASCRKEHRFFSSYSHWLNEVVHSINSQNSSKTPKRKSVGRPSLDFTSSGERSKRRKTESIRLRSSVEELTFAAQMKLREDGKVDEAKVVRDVMFGTPTRAQKYRNSVKSKHENTLSGEKALSVLDGAKTVTGSVPRSSKCEQQK